MKMGKRKWCLLLTAFLLMGLTVGLGVAALPPITPSKVSVNHAPINIDGDPSDWKGTAGADNTYVIDQGEGIWKDVAFDDTANGSIIYPNCTHTEPPIFDSAGASWSKVDNKAVALAYTDKFGGTSIEPYWYKHGGFCDLKEFRVTGGNDSAPFLYLMFRFENMGNTEIACEWNKGPDRQQYYKFGKIFIQVYIDKVSGSGRRDAIYKGNFNFSDECAWELVISVAGDPCDTDPGRLPEDGIAGWPRVTFANGTVALINHTDYCYASCNIYPSCIELKVPYSIIGNPRGGAWNFTVVAGGFDEGRWRQYWSTDLAQLMGWPPLFRFCGGEGGDPPNMGNDANIVDMAFISSQAEQEALLNEFQTTGQLVKIDAYQKIQFDENGNVVPWVPIYSIPILLMVILYVKKKKLNRLVEHK